MITWLIILISLWIYPILTYVLARLTRNRIFFKRRLIKITLGITFMSIFGLTTNISTTNKAIDWILLTSIYFSTCLFLWLVYNQSNRILKILAGIAMICIFGFGYISGTIGALGVGFVSAEYNTKIEKWLGDGLIYKETPLGNAIADYRGKRVEIYRTISWFPIIEWRIMHKEYFNFITYGNDLQVNYRPDLKMIYLSTSEYWGKEHELEIWRDTLKLEQ